MRWLLICFLFLTARYCNAQQYYETYSPANGLVDARITRVLQDGTGRLFFLTKDGISIYDGQRFTNHTKVAGIPLGIVNDGLLLPDGTLQLPTFSGNWVHSGRNGFVFDSSFSHSIPEVSEIIALGRTEWLVISNTGLYRIKNASSKKINLLQTLAGGRKRILEHLAVSGDRLIFCYNTDSVNHTFYLFDLTNNRMTDSLSVDRIMGMTVNDKGNVFLCTTSGILQVDNNELQKGKLRTGLPWFHSFLPPRMQADNIFFDRQENIWLINNSSGCTQINPFNGKVKTYSPADGLLTGVNSIYQDQENNYWFTAPGKGVQKLVKTNYEILNKWEDRALDPVVAINSSEDSSIFLCTPKKLFVVKNNELKEITNAQQSFLYPVFFWQHDYWTFAYPFLVNGKGKTLPLDNDSAYYNILPYSSPAVNNDRHGNLLLAGNHISIVRKNYSISTKPLPYFADNIVVDEQNNYWAFCRSNNIVKFSFINNNLVQQSSFLHPGLEPRFVIHMNKDTFWIATRYNGVIIAKVNDRALTIIGQLNRATGLSNDFVESLLKIDANRVAAGTAAGLDIITLAGNDTLVENLSARINHFEPILQLARDDRGLIYARTENLQLFRYDPSVITTSGYKPGAWFDRIQVNGHDTDTARTRFSYQQNNFIFSVSSPSFADNRSILFRFLLEKENRQWQQTSNKPDFEISNLPPGLYHLSVWVKYPGRMYPDEKLDYQFTIRSPFWKTWWFIFFLVLLVIFSAFYLVRNYLKRQLQRQKLSMEKELAIEQERTRMARELHDGLGSMLSGLKHSFTALHNQVPMDESYHEKFNYNIEKLNDTIKELRDISNSMDTFNSLKNGLESSLRDYCNFITQSTGIPVTYSSLQTSKALFTEEQVFHIFRIIQELIQNIIKHAGASSALVQTSADNGQFYITVEDDGKGFDYSSAFQRGGMGLKNIEARVKILKGKLDYNISRDKGTAVMIEFPCKTTT
jgi:signal transduction histidine kinase